MDADICCFSILALANLCLNVESHNELNVEVLISVFYNVLGKGNFEKYHNKDDETAFHKFVEAKSFACLAISALCQNSSIACHMTEVGIIPALLKLLQIDATEMKLHVAFVFSKLSKFSSTYQELGRYHVASSLTNPTHTHTYSISALRRLCVDKNLTVELILYNAVNFMAALWDLQNIERCPSCTLG